MIVRQEIRATERPHPLVETLSTRRPHGKSADILRRIAGLPFYFHGEWGGGGSEGEGVLTCHGFVQQGEVFLPLTLVVGIEEENGLVLRDVPGNCHSLDCAMEGGVRLLLHVGEELADEQVSRMAHWIALAALVDGFRRFIGKERSV